MNFVKAYEILRGICYEAITAFIRLLIKLSRTLNAPVVRHFIRRAASSD
jgi:hypothetical protein